MNVVLDAMLFLYLSLLCREVEANANCSNSKIKENAFIQLQEDFLSSPCIKNKVPPATYGPKLVNVSFTPYRIISVDEIRQSLSLVGQMLVEWWLDTPLWTPRDFCNMTQLHIPTEVMWTPAIVYSQTDDEDVWMTMPTRLEVNHDGVVRANIPNIFNVFCHLDLADFPFDSHTCEMSIIEIYGYKVGEGDYSYLDQVSGNLKWQSGEWILTDHGCDLVAVSIYTYRMIYTLYA